MSTPNTTRARRSLSTGAPSTTDHRTGSNIPTINHPLARNRSKTFTAKDRVMAHGSNPPSPPTNTPQDVSIAATPFPLSHNHNKPTPDEQIPPLDLSAAGHRLSNLNKEVRDYGSRASSSDSEDGVNSDDHKFAVINTGDAIVIEPSVDRIDNDRPTFRDALYAVPAFNLSSDSHNNDFSWEDAAAVIARDDDHDDEPSVQLLPSPLTPVSPTFKFGQTPNEHSPHEGTTTEDTTTKETTVGEMEGKSSNGQSVGIEDEVVPSPLTPASPTFKFAGLDDSHIEYLSHAGGITGDTTTEDTYAGDAKEKSSLMHLIDIEDEDGNAKEGRKDGLETPWGKMNNGGRGGEGCNNQFEHEDKCYPQADAQHNQLAPSSSNNDVATAAATEHSTKTATAAATEHSTKSAPKVATLTTLLASLTNLMPLPPLPPLPLALLIPLTLTLLLLIPLLLNITTLLKLLIFTTLLFGHFPTWITRYCLYVCGMLLMMPSGFGLGVGALVDLGVLVGLWGWGWGVGDEVVA